ncbi:MAG: ATP-dependent helicase [Clostridiales bacterium]|nr:ATP-dependent helicase [Clostridiales bacterium]
MIKQGLLNGFNKSTFGNNEKKGERVLKNDLVTDISYEEDNDEIIIKSMVISEELYSQYSNIIRINKETKEVTKTKCNCNDFEKKNKENYCCKHLVATFYKFLDMIDANPNILKELGINNPKKELIKATEKNILDYLVGNNDLKEEIKFEIIINKDQWNHKIFAEFKIGSINMNSKKLYTLKDIDSFLIAMYNRVSLPFGKDFIFDIKKQKVSSNDNQLIKFIELLKEIDGSTSYRKINERLVKGKTITIPNGLLRNFLNIARNYRIYLGSGFYSKVVETEIINDNLPLPFNLKETSNLIKLEMVNGVPEALNENMDAFLYNGSIYLPSYEQLEVINPYIEAFTHGNTIFFSKDEENRVLTELIPSMQKVSNNIMLSPSLKNKIVIAPVKFKFYFDKDKDITLTLKVQYDVYEFNYFDTFKEKVIYRNKEKEDEVVSILRNLGFGIINNQFIFLKDDDYIFQFFKVDILKLHDIGEVYYSERFTGIKSISKNSFKGQIKKGRYDYFEFKFSVDNISNEEMVYILRAFRNNKKYFRLKSGEFLDLEEIELKKLLKLVDTLEDNNLNDGIITFNQNKGMYLEDYIEEEGLRYIKGRTGLKSLKKSLSNLKNKEFIIPEKINSYLRAYQKEGVKWMLSLNYLGFGGILGDEMGLGKTLQTIAFLSSMPNSHTIVIAPTSLIYNWVKEFNTFAPNIKVIILNGDKDERKANIKSYEKYDVLITTYNLLRRDIEEFKDINFDYVILDEAQNIKNPSSLNAKACKSLKAKNRFALTGTPIENSLMELWSIFDFIMPGYLYDEKRFTTRYFRRLDEDECIIEELNKLIKPFIMRRYKKNVIKELPSKIEKKLIVPMTDGQKKVYESYANYAKDIIKKKVKDEEFKKSKIEILSYITKLRQIALDPSLVMDNYSEGSGKIESLIETLEQSIEQGHKILLFSQFTSALKNIAKILKETKISYYYLDGETPSKKRMELVDNFNNNDISVFLISLKAGGTGLNLTSADIVIHFDPWWNPAVEDQATDRAHRIGQKKVVEVIKMISAGTVEEKIISLQEEKKNLIDKVVGEKNELGNIMNSLKDEDILTLFSIK